MMETKENQEVKKKFLVTLNEKWRSLASSIFPLMTLNVKEHSSGLGTHSDALPRFNRSHPQATGPDELLCHAKQDSGEKWI